jgi:hypothetical protein
MIGINRKKSPCRFRALGYENRRFLPLFRASADAPSNAKIFRLKKNQFRIVFFLTVLKKSATLYEYISKEVG